MPEQSVNSRSVSECPVSVSWRQRWNRIEGYAGLTAAFVLVYAPVVIGGLAVIFATLMAEWRVACVAAPVVAVSLPMALWLTHLCRVAVNEFRAEEAEASSCGDEEFAGTPLAVLVSAAIPRLPQLARIPLFLWWAAHFVAGIALVTSQRLHNEMGWRFFFEGLSGVATALCFTFAANIFLVLSITALLNSSATIPRVWEHRVLVDFFCVSPLLIRTLAA